ncbi:MAG: autotransporter outer membrane beta-barrel domain-containing protein [Elusimicrobia bacterium]|nr:autotransporter outer membrane beta-barrel domain-containing protein [Elusimicrobiota bacterium]
MARKTALFLSATAALHFSLSLPALSQDAPSMSDDFEKITEWLSHEIVEGLAFNAGSTFDPPREVKGLRLQPDLSLGVGMIPLDKSKFPEMATHALREIEPAGIFSSKVLIPNLAMHLRLGLPARFDLAIRGANMTTPPRYRISPKATGKGQSNSIGFSLRKHMIGGERPLLTVGANYNHVFGRFDFNSRFDLDEIEGFSASSDIDGLIAWDVRSYGLNAVLSQTFGAWTPFAGLGYNHARGSVRSRIEALSETPLFLPVVGESSQRPETNSARVILGAQLNYSWVNFFTNGEVKAIGVGKGKTFIVHAGLSLPFEIGRHGFYSASGRRVDKSQPLTARTPRRGNRREAESDLFFIQ